jgi:hypothetical protein
MRKRMRFGGPITQPVVVAIAGPHTRRTAPSCIRFSPAQRLRDVVDPQEIQTVAHHSEGRGLLATRHQPTSPALRPLGLAHGSGQGCCPRDLRHVRPQRRPLPGGVAALEPHLGPIPRPTGHPDHRDTCRTLDTPTELSPESMPTNGRCSSRSTTHRCHTCCLRIHATAFRTLQDAEPRRSVIIRRET